MAFGAADLLEGCLRSLGGELPVTVVDNSSDADVRSVCEAHGATYIDPGRNLGFAAGVNAGLTRRRQTDGDVLLLNPDATITADAVRSLQRCLHGRADMACVAPGQTDPSGASRDRVAWPFPSPLGAWLDALGLGRLNRSPQFVIGSVLLLRAAALADVGPFDERFFLYAEETDWQLRAHRHGWRAACCSGVTATHVGAGTGGDAKERAVHFHASQERYIRKHHGSTGWQVYRWGTIVGAAARSLLLRGVRRQDAASRLDLYRRGPCRVESLL